MASSRCYRPAPPALGRRCGTEGADHRADVANRDHDKAQGINGAQYVLGHEVVEVEVEEFAPESSLTQGEIPPVDGGLRLAVAAKIASGNRDVNAVRRSAETSDFEASGKSFTYLQVLEVSPGTGTTP